MFLPPRYLVSNCSGSGISIGSSPSFSAGTVRFISETHEVTRSGGGLTDSLFMMMLMPLLLSTAMLGAALLMTALTPLQLTTVMAFTLPGTVMTQLGPQL